MYAIRSYYAYDNILERVERLENALKNGLPAAPHAEEIEETDKKKHNLSVEKSKNAEKHEVNDAELFPDEYIPLPEYEEQEYFPYMDEEPIDAKPPKEKKEEKNKDLKQQAIDILVEEIKEDPKEKKAAKKAEPADEKQISYNFV